jgi:hypothetical protein
MDRHALREILNSENLRVLEASLGKFEVIREQASTAQNMILTKRAKVKSFNFQKE